jgi:hypothetical protein
VLQGIADSIISSLRPVRPMPPTWLLTGGLALTGLAVACAAAALTSFIGFRNLNLGARALIFSTLAILVWGAGSEFVRQWIPGSRQRLMPAASLTIGIAILLGVFAWVFRDYRTDHFIEAGIACLGMGLLLAVPAALLSWLLLRRGFAVNCVAAGLAGGTLAGLCGVTLLELHCPNFQAAHVLVWHTGVVPVSAAVGALVGWLTNRRPREVGGRKRR